MFSHNDLLSLNLLRQDYHILVSNGHDIRMRSRITGHEWVIISPYDGGPCEILHRHSCRDPFHHQKGRYPTLLESLAYIKNHDAWYSQKQCNEVDADI